MRKHQRSRRQRSKTTGVRRVARWSGNLALVVVLLACLAWLVPALFGYSRYVITGGSMTGAYDKGSLVFEKPVPVADLEVGDVITYLPPADSGVPNLVTHRITKLEPAEGGGTLFTTKGDANAQADPWHFVLLDQSQPVVEFGVPHAGWIFMALADREVRMLVIGLPAALIALGALGQLVGAIRGRRDGEIPTPAVAAAEPVTAPVEVQLTVPALAVTVSPASPASPAAPAMPDQLIPPQRTSPSHRPSVPAPGPTEAPSRELV